MKVKHIEAVFDNGDKLILTMKQVKFIGYVGSNLFELFYAERFEGRYDDDVIGDIINDRDHYFIVHQLEYFPADAFSDAKAAFDLRLNSSNPVHESGQSFSVDDILKKE